MSENERKTRKRSPSFRIERSGTEEKKNIIFDKLNQIRNELTKKSNRPMGNLQVMKMKILGQQYVQAHVLGPRRLMLTRKISLLLRSHFAVAFKFQNGMQTYKVLKCEHVTKAHDIVSQCHEKVGTVSIYQYMKDKDERVGVHCHDRNLSINKNIRKETETLNQNDTWHCVKAMQTAMKKISVK
ncbi:unnamed protein product [Mytilus coruscus]|uniref:Uncharacterized protein n=1 Tax=Mytilus coruscus TaxID=42192 RepID=A0A6J8EQ38_MYTCO|nr:unnamed protein product [Mytilus coruscus]